MAQQFQGKVTHVIDRTFTKKDGDVVASWAMRVEEEKDQHPNSVYVDFYGDTVSKPSVGDKIEVFYNPNTYVKDEKTIYTNNKGWKFETIEKATAEVKDPLAGMGMKKEPVSPPIQDDGDNLPF